MTEAVLTFCRRDLFCWNVVCVWTLEVGTVLENNNPSCLRMLERHESELSGRKFFHFLTAEALTVEETSLDLPKNPVKQPESWDAGTSMLPPASVKNGEMII